MLRRTLIALSCLAAAASAHASDTAPRSLVFDPKAYTVVHVTIDGMPTEVRRYHVTYVAKPMAIDLTRPPTLGGPKGPGGPGGPGRNAPPPFGGPVTDPLAYQSMYIYVPAASYANAKAAVILQVGNAGWVASAARDVVSEGAAFSSTSNTDNTGAALKAGYVVVNAGTRGRNLRSPNGDWVGKAPAVVLDAKAAIRYLRLNDRVMAGSAERIVITGTSGGGGLSVAVAASGNSPDYYPNLAAVGAAGVDAAGRSTLRDDVFATIAYCPINDLGHADLAYEWQYHAVRTAANISGGRYTPDVTTASATLADGFPAYLAGLRLKREDGRSLDAAGMRETIIAMVRRSVEGAIARGEAIPAIGEDFTIAPMGPPGTPAAPRAVPNDWLTVANRQVAGIDYDSFLRFVASITPLKVVPAFDATASTGNAGALGENSLFGPATATYSNFTPYGWNHNAVQGDGSGPDDTGLAWAAYVAGPGAELARQVRMTSPIPYLTGTTKVAPHWYVRHGLIDRDTSFATQATLYHAIRSAPGVQDVDFRLAWLKGHAGNYDVQEAYAWLAGILRKAG